MTNTITLTDANASINGALTDIAVTENEYILLFTSGGETVGRAKILDAINNNFGINEQGIIQADFTGLEFTVNGTEVPLDFSTASTEAIVTASTQYPASAIAEDITALYDATNNALRYNQMLKQKHNWRIDFDYDTKNDKKEYSLVFMFSYPNGTFSRKVKINLAKKNEAEAGLSVFFTSLSNNTNINQGLQVSMILQKHDEDTPTGDSVNVKIKEVTCFTEAIGTR